MSEASQKESLPVNPIEGDPLALAEALQLLRQLASLNRKGELGELVEAPLHAQLTRPQAALWLQCSESTLKNEAEAGDMPHYYVGNQMRFDPQTVLDFKLRRFRRKDDPSKL